MSLKLDTNPNKEEADDSFDPAVNPSQDHYDEQFNQIVGSPDNKKFNDDVDANNGEYTNKDAREDLGNAEKSAAPVQNSDVKSSDLNQKREAIKDNESRNSPEPDIPYKQNPKKSGKKGLKGLASKRAKMAVAAAAVSIIVSVLSFTALLPLKIVHIAENLQERFTSMGQGAVEERSERLMGKYLRQHVLPGIKNGSCRSTIDRTCVSKNIDGNNPATRLFNAWKQSNFETKLATDYGVEFYKDPSGVSMRTTAIPKGVNIDDFVNGNSDDLFSSKNLRGKNNVRNAYKDAIQDKNKLKQTWNRFKVGTLLSKKYGIARCVFACKTRDNFADWKGNKKKAFQMALIYRVVEPNSEAYSAIIECLISTNCADRDSNKPGAIKIDETTLAEDGVDNITKKLTQKFGKESAEEIIGTANAILEKGIMVHIIEKLISKVFGDAAGKTASTVGSKAIPVIGWIDLAVTLFDLASKGKEVIAAARFAIIASTAVPTFYLLLSHADEIKSGRVDPQIVESAMSSLNPTETDGQGAEISPLFSEIMGGEAPAVSFFNKAVYAQDGSNTNAGTQNEVMKCNDGKKISPDRLVCEEESLGLSNQLLDKLDNFLAKFGFVGVFVDAWKATVRKVMNFVGDYTGSIVGKAMSAVPGVDSFISKFGDFLIGLLKLLFNIPEVDKMSGAQFFNSAAGGATVTGVQSASFGIGAPKLTKPQVVSIATEQYEQKQYAFKQKSFFSRLASRDDSQSLISQIALVMPGNISGLKKSAVNLALNPFSSYGLTLAAATSTNAVADGNVYGNQTWNAFNAFDMQPSGVALDNPVLNNDPEDATLFSDEACKIEEERWLNKDNFDIDPDTQFAYPKTVNRCRLEKTATCAVGALFATKLTDLCDEGDQSGGENSNSDTLPPPTGSPIDKSKDTSAMACAAGASNERIEAVGDGSVKIKLCDYGGVIGVNASWSSSMGPMIAAAKNEGVSFSGGGFRTAARQIELRKQNCGSSQYAIFQMSPGSCSPPTARPGTSNHELGLAIDFSGCTTSTSCYKWLKANANKYGVFNLPSEYWHWSYNGK